MQTSDTSIDLNNLPSTGAGITLGRRLPKAELVEETLKMAFEISEMDIGDVNSDGLPELIVGTGGVSENGEVIGHLDLSFRGAPSFLSLPPELGDNPFGLKVGQVLPAWMGPVSYHLKGGSLQTMELAWVLPSNPEDPTSPTIVLSISQVTSGTGRFAHVVGGTVLTRDGFGGKGSLEIQLLKTKEVGQTV